MAKDQEIKTIITDFDETLWSGIIAEGEHPELNREYYNFLVSLYNKGVVLFGLTKNDEKDVGLALRKLKIDKNIFVAIIANWESKAKNVELLFQQLELRPDTTLFIDDNPLELAEVSGKIKNVVTLNAKNWKRLMNNVSLRKQISSRKSVIDRYKKYRHALQLLRAKQVFKGTDEAFLYSRNRSIQIGEPRLKNELDRVAELFYRTNRLNINRRPLASIEQAKSFLTDLRQAGSQIIAISVKDGGKSLGIQAAFTVSHQGRKAIITNGTISCSMISFGDFEKKILNEIFKQLFQAKKSIEILVKKTSTNYRIRELLKEFRFKVNKQQKGRYRFYLDRNNFKEIDVPWVKTKKADRVRYEYFGVPGIADYFIEYEWGSAKPNSKVVVLGIGQGETLGAKLTDKYVKHLKSINAKYFPIDIERYGTNIVADAENLQKLFKNETIDYIICSELLEHTNHYWKVINEMLRILKIQGRIFLSVPYNYPTHEYPIDKWRLSFPYLKKVFTKCCEIKRVQLIGNKKYPRHILMSLVKTRSFTQPITQTRGRVDWSTGLTYV